MKLSVVIPYYKNAKEIKRSLSSVFAQTFQDFEVLLINDASPDWEMALPIIKSFDDNRLKIISHETNQNGAVARNTGIKAAQGEFIAFLDADDEWLTAHLSNLLKTQKNNDSDLLYSSCSVHSFNDFKYVLPKKSFLSSKNLSEYLFCDSGFIATPSIMIRTSKAQQILFNEHLKRHQDYDFLLRLEADQIKFAWSKEVTVIVHWEENDIESKGGTWEFSEKWFKEYKQYMSSKAKTCFMLKFVVLRLLQNRQIILGLLKFFKYCRLWHVSPKNSYFLISTLLFGEFKHPFKWKK